MGAISRINRARARFQQENEREPTDAELAEFLDLTRERVRQLKEKAIRKLARPEIRKNLVQYR
jgi:DNA-directed RNA polymerase sigma subunit (sigma70/sigma32)